MTHKQQRALLAWLLLVTTIVLTVMLTIQVRGDHKPPTVFTMTVAPTTVKETVICAGTVRVAEGTEVTVNVPCVTKEVCVKEGDRVEKGDVLLTVDRGATLAMAVAMGVSETQLGAASAMLPEAVTAPQAGVVRAVNAAAGDTLTTDAPCVVLAKGGEVEVALTVRESVLPKLAVGQTVTVSGVAFEKKSYRGVLSYIADTARNRVSGTTTETVVDAVVTLSVSQIDASLMPGLNAKATVLTATRDNVIVVPYEAWVSDEKGDAVYCVQNGVAFRRTVTVGEELVQGVEIIAGLQAGESVVTDAADLSGEWRVVETKEVA